MQQSFLRERGRKDENYETENIRIYRVIHTGA